MKGLSTKEIDRSKNFFALGLTFWIFDRPLEPTFEWVDQKFARLPTVAEANKTALQAGYSVGHNTEAFQTRYRIRRAHLGPGVYRQITGNEALALGLVTAAVKANKPSILWLLTPLRPLATFCTIWLH